MKLAALRYSPEIADAFHPTETERPATKKSEADLEVLAERKPIQIVMATVTREKPKIQGSMCEMSMWVKLRIGVCCLQPRGGPHHFPMPSSG